MKIVLTLFLVLIMLGGDFIEKENNFVGTIWDDFERIIIKCNN